MAEDGGYSKFTYSKTRQVKGGFKKSHNREEHPQESVPGPKILIKKRPPRRPKLGNGEDAPISTITQAVEGCAEVWQLNEDDTKLCTDVIGNNVHMESEIECAGEQLLALCLSQESLVSDNTETSLSTPEHKESLVKGLEQNSKKKARRNRAKKNKCGTLNHGNEGSGVNKTSEPNTSTYQGIDQVEKSREKEEKKKQKCIENRIKNKAKKSYTAANDKNNQKAQISKTDKKKKEKRTFNKHIPTDVAQQLLSIQDPENPNMIEGHIRINPRCYQNAYISLPNDDQDLLIVGLRDRNRALEGDLVVVNINPKHTWFQLTETTYQKTGQVLSILEKVHPRKAVGCLKKQDVFVFLHPRDSRVPLIKINPRTVPKHFYDNPDQFKDTLFLCNIVDWQKVAFAEGEILKTVGKKGDLSVETNAILLENDLTLIPYDDELLQDLPSPDYIPTDEDLIDREDLRETCIFTIDPATAVDLDDAVSCKPLENGNFEIGVHIADVTHFLEAFSPLDIKVAERATTVYMVDRVYHMLPKQLCLACSLLPGQDKLAFSVILELTPNAEIITSRFSKTVIRSCCQMSYEQAQLMIDNEFYDWERNDSLKITGNYKPSDLSKVVRNLYKISTKLKKKRFDNGALKIDRLKLLVVLDKDTRLPSSYKFEEKLESNSLIEEFMLLANMTVAKYLYETLPNVSLLRSHAEPLKRMLQKTRDLLAKYEIYLDIDSAGSLNNSLLQYQPKFRNNQNEQSFQEDNFRFMVIKNLCSKSITRATYKCTGLIATKDNLRHYALNTDYYTHFTSPIRRYPDCVVHRLLYAAIKNKPVTAKWSSKICAEIAMNCNQKIYSAKLAQEQSNTLYFTYMLDLQGSMNVLAVVTDVKERSADTMLVDTGLKVRLYFSDTIEETVCDFVNESGDTPTVNLLWKERNVSQLICIFSILHIKITKHERLFRLQGILLPP